MDSKRARKAELLLKLLGNRYLNHPPGTIETRIAFDPMPRHCFAGDDLPTLYHAPSPRGGIAYVVAEQFERMIEGREYYDPQRPGETLIRQSNKLVVKRHMPQRSA